MSETVTKKIGSKELCANKEYGTVHSSVFWLAHQGSGALTEPWELGQNHSNFMGFQGKCLGAFRCAAVGCSLQKWWTPWTRSGDSAKLGLPFWGLISWGLVLGSPVLGNSCNIFLAQLGMASVLANCTETA